MDISFFPAAERVVEQMSKKEEPRAWRDQPKPNWTLDIVKNEEYGPKLVQILGLGAGVGEDRQACCPLWSWKSLRD